MTSSSSFRPSTSMVDDAFQEFVQLVQGARETEDARQRTTRQAAEKKGIQLTPIRQLLKRFIDAGLVVHHAESYNPGRKERPKPQPLEVFEDESSPPWRPGNSIYFDHPAMVEISVPNDIDVDLEGVVVIRCSSAHPQSSLLTRKFSTMAEACMALAKFLALSAYSADRMPPPKTAALGEG